MEVQKPLISIITATYNSEKTVSETFNSILKQTYTGTFEYIVVDGNSSDNTVSIIKEFELKFKQRNIVFKWLSESDKGIYDAWNKGLSLATGNWISFIGSDDKYTSNALQVYSQNIYDNPGIEYFHSLISVYNSNNVYLRTLKSQINEDGLPIRIAHVGTFHSKKLFNSNGSYSLQYKIASDYEFLVRQGFLKHKQIDEALVIMDDGGVSGSFKTNIECFKIMKRAKGFPNSLAYYYFFLWGCQFYTYLIISKLFGVKFVPKVKRFLRK